MSQDFQNLILALQDNTRAVLAAVDALKKGTEGGGGTAAGSGGAAGTGGGPSGGSPTQAASQSPQAAASTMLSNAQKLVSAAAPGSSGLAAAGGLLAGAAGGPASLAAALTGLVGQELQQLNQANVSRAQFASDVYVGSPPQLSNDQARRKEAFESQQRETHARIEQLNRFAETGEDAPQDFAVEEMRRGKFNPNTPELRARARSDAAALEDNSRRAAADFAANGPSPEVNALQRTHAQLRNFVELGGLRTPQGRANFEARLRVNQFREDNAADALQVEQELSKKIRSSSQHVQRGLQH